MKKQTIIPHPSQARKPLHGRHADLVAKATAKPTLRGLLKELCESWARIHSIEKSPAYGPEIIREIEALLERKDLQ